jgi:hypothetical protein
LFDLASKIATTSTTFCIFCPLDLSCSFFTTFEQCSYTINLTLAMAYYKEIPEHLATSW